MLGRTMPGHEHEDFRRIRSPFEGALVCLRALEEGELPRVNELFWDPDVTAGVGAGWPEPLAGTRTFWERARANPATQLFAIDVGGELVGACSLESIDPRNRSVKCQFSGGTGFPGSFFGSDLSIARRASSVNGTPMKSRSRFSASSCTLPAAPLLIGCTASGLHRQRSS